MKLFYKKLHPVEPKIKKLELITGDNKSITLSPFVQSLSEKNMFSKHGFKNTEEEI